MKTKFLLFTCFFLGLYFAKAQTDTLYVMKGGHVLDKYNITNQLDSTIYYNPSDLSKTTTDSIYVIKNSLTVEKFNVYKDLDSIIFDNPINLGVWPTIKEAKATTFSPTVLTVLLDFSDTNIDSRVSSAESKWAQLMYGLNHGQGNDYWYETSGGRVQLKPASETNGIVNNGVVKVKLSQAQPTISVNPDSQTWFKDALNMLVSTVNFASFDKNGDNKLSDLELSVFFVINVDYSKVNLSAPAVANIKLNHLISGTGITLENYTRSTIFDAASLGVPMHELAHHFLELNHFAAPSDHCLMGMGAYTQDPIIGNLINPSWKGGTRPTGLMGQSAIFGGLLSATPITGTTLGVKLHAPEKGAQRNILQLQTKDGILYIENRTKWGYDQSIPFCTGSEGGIFFTEASQYVMPLNIPAITRDFTATNFVEGDTDFCEYYAHAGHNDNFEYGGWRFENISVAGPIMTMDIIKLNDVPIVDHYKLVYWEIDPTRTGYRRKTHKRIDATTTPNINLSELVGGNIVSNQHPIWIDAYYTTGEVRNINAFATYTISSPYVSVIKGSSFTNESAILSTAIVNIKFNTTQTHTPTATVNVDTPLGSVGKFTMTNIPAP